MQKKRVLDKGLLAAEGEERRQEILRLGIRRKAVGKLRIMGMPVDAFPDV